MASSFYGRGMLLILAFGAGSAAFAANGSAESFGGVYGPATLPGGAIATYAFVGVPELAAGYRQGLGGIVELEARARFQYLDLAIAGELQLKFSLWHDDRNDIALGIGGGIVGNSGSQYFDPNNLQFVSIRAMLTGVATHRLGESVRAIGLLEVPYDFGLGAPAGARFTPLGGGGLEVYLGGDATALLLGELGADVLRQPLGVPFVRLGYAVRLGVAFRLF